MFLSRHDTSRSRLFSVLTAGYTNCFRQELGRRSIIERSRCCRISVKLLTSTYITRCALFAYLGVKEVLHPATASEGPTSTKLVRGDWGILKCEKQPIWKAGSSRFEQREKKSSHGTRRRSVRSVSGGTCTVPGTIWTSFLTATFTALTSWITSRSVPI